MPTLDIRQAALKFLVRREHSFSELTHKLQQKAFCLEEIKEELKLLQKEGLQSDLRFCEAFIHERIRLGYGPRAIEALLRERGLEETLIAQCMSVYSEAFWHEQLQKAWRKKFAPKQEAKLADLAGKARQYRFLAQRGFESQAIHRLLK